MSFLFPEIIVESVIRDGLADLRAHPERVDNVFASLKLPYAATKYGNNELTKIKKILNRDVAVVHSFAEVAAQDFCYSIQLGQDVEDRQLSIIDDFEDDVLEPITDPIELQNLVILDNLIPVSFNLTTGIITLDPMTNLTSVNINNLFVDAANTEHKILQVVDGATKQLVVEPNIDVDISDFCLIKSSIDSKQYEIRGVASNVNLLIGVHSKDALTTKYLYTLLKYFLTSRKADLIARQFIVATFQGSDFTRDFQYEGDIVYTRFFTLSGKIRDNWRSDEVTLIENVNVTTLVPADEATTDNLNKEDSTIQVAE